MEMVYWVGNEGYGIAESREGWESCTWVLL